MKDEIKEKLKRALDLFKGSFVNRRNEIILHKGRNVYFMLDNIESPIHFDYKIISFLSFYTASHHENKDSAMCNWAWMHINHWFNHYFNYDDLQIIYQKIGCNANKDLGIQFISS